MEGNQMKIREALVDIVLLTVKAGKSIPSDVACGIIASKAKRALSEPARNVDTVKSLDDFLSEKYQDDADLEMIKEWREDEVTFCLRHPFAGSLLHSLRWLFLSAKEGDMK